MAGVTMRWMMEKKRIFNGVEARKTSNTRRTAWVWLTLLATLALPVGASESPEPVTESELANLVLQDCGSCHGMTLRGGLGPALRPENLEGLSVEAIAAIIREGVPDTAMPPWEPLLAPQDIRWISRELKTGTLISP